MVPLQNDARAIKKFAKELADTYKDCFAWYSEESYVRGFAARRFETVCAINEEEHDIVISKKNKKLFVDEFSKWQLNNILYMKFGYDIFNMCPNLTSVSNLFYNCYLFDPIPFNVFNKRTKK